MSHTDTAHSGFREERKHRLLKARVRVGSNEHDILIKNLSSRGLGGICTDVALTPGTDLSVLLPDGHIVDGLVKWSDGRRFGIALAREISADAQVSYRSEEPTSTWQVKRLHRVVTPRTDPSTLRRVT